MSDHEEREVCQRLDMLEVTVADLVRLLRGADDDGHAGLVGKVRRHGQTLYGANDREFGMVHKINVLWRSWIWLLCTASAGVGGLLVWFVERFQ